jgi:Ca2+-transporting ATPase
MGVLQMIMANSAAGLTSAEASRRLAATGPNTLPAKPPEPTWRRFLRQFTSPLVAILLVALLVDLAVWRFSGPAEPPLEAAAIAAILLLNAGLGYWQERKAERALGALRALSAPQVWVRRDGALRRAPSAELVPSDLFRLDAGDRVPADATAGQADDLLLDESVLTGESVAVAKAAGEEVFAGTLVVRGRGWAEVTRTGAASAMGRVAGMLDTITTGPTPLERRLADFGRRVAWGIVLLAAAMALSGLLAEGTSRFAQLFLVSVALAVAAVPEGLPAAVTFALALGVERMAKRQAVVRRMDAVEALGSVTVVATDKTGTLTENRMEVRELLSDDRPRALRAMVLANDADPLTSAGDPLELALLAYARHQGIIPEEIQEDAPRIGSRAFDSSWRFMRVTVVEPDAPVTYLKGAPEILASRCRLTERERSEWLARADTAGRDGLRPIALAWAPGESEEGLTWLGLVLLWDPPRPEAADAVRRCLAAGVRVVMITGDHPATARAVAHAVGLDAEPLVLGEELDAMAPSALRDAVGTTAVFARVTAEHKLRIVEALQARGEIVAVTGDGVNDAPALKRADVGIAMGLRGSAVSREVADVVLLDDHFATIVAAIEEGRSIFQNIRKFLRFLFSTNLSEVVVVAGGFLGALILDLRDVDGSLLLPLTAAQLLWVNLVTDGAPALALALDRNPGVMGQRPRPLTEALLDPVSTRFILITGLAKALVAVSLLFLLPLTGEPPHVVRTAVFLFVAAGQVLFAYPARRTGAPLPTNRILHGAVILTLLLQPVVVLSPWLQGPFDTHPLRPLTWAAVAASVVLAWAIAEVTGRVLRREQSEASFMKDSHPA